MLTQVRRIHTRRHRQMGVCAYYTQARIWCFTAMSVFQKSTCKSWQNCPRIWNQSCAHNWLWCLSTRSASKWGQEAHVNTDNATKIFPAQVLLATQRESIRCLDHIWLRTVATCLCQRTCMCGYCNANEWFSSKDMISGVHYRCFCQPCSVPLFTHWLCSADCWLMPPACRTLWKYKFTLHAQ